MSTLVDRLVVLKENTLFRGLPIHELLHIAGITRDYKLPTGSTFIRAGEKGNELFILIDGEVGGQSLDDGGQAGTVGFSGGQVSQHGQRVPPGKVTEKDRLLPVLSKITRFQGYFSI